MNNSCTNYYQPPELSLQQIEETLHKYFSSAIHFDPEQVNGLTRFNWYDPKTQTARCKLLSGFLGKLEDCSLTLDSIHDNGDGTVTVTAKDLELRMPGQEELDGGTMTITFRSTEEGWQYQSAYFVPLES